SVEADAGSRIQGNGQLGPTRMAGTIAPGNSIGTLTVAGDYVQLPGSTYEAELGPAGTSDLLQVNGRASLQGGTLRPTLLGATAMLGQNYRVLNASGGVEGRFATVDGSLPTPFLSFAARYAASTIDVAIARGLPLVSAAITRNQRSIAAAADATPDANLLPQRLTSLAPAQLPAALDALGGELHASARALLLQDTQLLRDAALTRARNGQDAFTAQSLSEGRRGAWADVQQSERRTDDNGNASSARLSADSLLVGYDHRLQSGWQLGVLGGGGKGSLRVREGQDRARVRSRHAGLHLGRRWGALGLRMGAGYSWQDLRTQRSTAIAGQPDPRARYDADTAQWFAELGYRVDGTRGGIEPFVQYTGLRLSSDAAQEAGRAQALSIASAQQTISLWSGGLRFNLDLAARDQPQRWLSLRGSVAYQQADGDLTPAARMQWQDGPAFTVWGVPLARLSSVATLGVAARLSRSSLLTFDWRGAFARRGRDTGIGVHYSLRF
ncbi:MAG TPA: autotransporter domain-containing protein, partial [Stenotrophomonas sp.]|nr:autotransporter domain-containing protein [Stenotrophomonas sp.]